MGNCSFKPDGDGLLDHNEDASKTTSSFLTFLMYLVSLSKHNFTFQYVIGRGGFGKVTIDSYNC